MMMMMRDALDDVPCNMTRTRHSLDDTPKSQYSTVMLFIYGVSWTIAALFGSCEGFKCRRGFVLKYLRGRRVKVVQLITRIDVGLLLLVTSLSPSCNRYH